MDMMAQYVKELGDCPCNCSDDPCQRRCDLCRQQVSCKWVPAFYTECNENIESSTRMWNKYWDNVYNTIQWYINVTNPLIRKVHDTGWNNYLNNERIVYIKTAVLTAYSDWASEVIAIPVDPFAGQSVSCPPVEMAGITPPNPFSKKPKHIKVYEEKCDDVPYGVPGFTIISNCHYMKFAVEGKIGPVKAGLSYTTVTDKDYAENHGYTHSFGGSFGVSQKFANVAEVGVTASWEKNYNSDGDLVGATKSLEVAAGVNVGLTKWGGKASASVQFDKSGNISGYSTTTAVSGGAKLDLGNDLDITPTAEVSSTRNYDANGTYTGGASSAGVSVQGGEKAGLADLEHTYTGIGVTQVIQVVAGQNQASPVQVVVK